MAKTCTYTILAPGRNLTRGAGGAIYRYAVVWKDGDIWRVARHNGLHRDMIGAMRAARKLVEMNEERIRLQVKAVEAVLISVDGVRIPGAVEQRVQEKVDRLQANADRTFQRAAEKAGSGNKNPSLIRDFKAYERWITEIKTQIKAV